MQALNYVLAQISPAIFFAAAVLCCCIAFFVYYWLAMRPRKNSLEWIALSENRPRRLSFSLRRHPMERRDALPLVLITALYAFTAFFRLGNLTGPEREVRFQQGDSYEFSYDRPVTVDKVSFFTSLGTGYYRLEWYAEGKGWQSVKLDQPYNAMFKWRELDLSRVDRDGVVISEENKNTDQAPVGPVTAQRFRVTAARAERPEGLWLAELALWQGEDRPDSGLHSDLPQPQPLPLPDRVDEGGQALFDEAAEWLYHGSYMDSSYFDEIYHPRTALEHLNNVKPYEISHPPLGKLIIALGVHLFGMTPFGWRFMGTLFGVLMLPILYAFLKNMFGKTTVAACGTTLFAVDFMHLTQTRIATIDTYGVFFILCMYWFMYRWLTLPANIPLRKSLPSLFLCGLSWSIGVACKWTVIYGGVGLAVLWVIGMVLKYQEWTPEGAEASGDGETSGRPPRYAPFFWGTAALSVVFFIVMPLCVYTASYFPYAAADGDTSWQHLLHIVWDNQIYMFTYHEGVHTPHPYSSRWYQWIVDGRPILYYREQDLFAGSKSLFAAFDNPVVSWAGLLCVIGTGIETFRKKSARALFITLGYLSQLVPWMLIFRITFAYHYFPSMLFLVLAIAYAMDGMLERDKPHARLAVCGLTGLAVALYAAFYPVLMGLYTPKWYNWNFLRWLPSWPL